MSCDNDKLGEALRRMREHNLDCINACGKHTSYDRVKESRNCDARRDCPDCPMFWTIDINGLESQPSSDVASAAPREPLKPGSFEENSFVDWSNAKVTHWGEIPSDDEWVTAKNAECHFDLEAYIDSLQWSDQATDHEKTLVIGNLRSMFAVVRAKHNAFVIVAKELAACYAKAEKDLAHSASRPSCPRCGYPEAE